ncbi:hypothetical protein BJX99DRAFT_236606 [Aspergillus californicus]
MANGCSRKCWFTIRLADLSESVLYQIDLAQLASCRSQSNIRGHRQSKYSTAHFRLIQNVPRCCSPDPMAKSLSDCVRSWSISCMVLAVSRMVPYVTCYIACPPWRPYGSAFVCDTCSSLSPAQLLFPAAVCTGTRAPARTVLSAGNGDVVQFHIQP